MRTNEEMSFRFCLLPLKLGQPHGSKKLQERHLSWQVAIVAQRLGTIFVIKYLNVALFVFSPCEALSKALWRPVAGASPRQHPDASSVPPGTSSGLPSVPLSGGPYHTDNPGCRFPSGCLSLSYLPQKWEK